MVNKDLIEHGHAMLSLNDSFAAADRRNSARLEESRTLSRALLECMEIIDLDERRAFVLSVYKKLNARNKESL